MPYPVEDLHPLFFRQRDWRTQLRVTSDQFADVLDTTAHAPEPEVNGQES